MEEQQVTVFVVRLPGESMPGDNDGDGDVHPHHEGGVVWILVFGNPPETLVQKVIAAETALAKEIARRSTRDGGDPSTSPPLVCPRRGGGSKGLTVSLTLTAAAAAVVGMVLIPAQAGDSGPPGGEPAIVGAPSERIPEPAPSEPPVGLIEPVHPPVGESVTATAVMVLPAPSRSLPSPQGSGRTAAPVGPADPTGAAPQNGGPPCSLLCLVRYMLGAE